MERYSCPCRLALSIIITQVCEFVLRAPSDPTYLPLLVSACCRPHLVRVVPLKVPWISIVQSISCDSQRIQPENTRGEPFKIITIITEASTGKTIGAGLLAVLSSDILRQRCGTITVGSDTSISYLVICTRSGHVIWHAFAYR